MTVRLISLVIGWVLGHIQTAYIYGKIKGIDIREFGSGNAGTTNMLRTLGTVPGLLVLVGDIGKSLAASLIVYALFGKSHPEVVYVCKLYAALGCVLGHNFPIYMKFKGGKGVAVTAGFIFGFSPIYVPVALLGFLIPFLITHYVSLGSLCMVSAFGIALIVQMAMGVYGASPIRLAEMLVIALFLIGLCFYQHRENIDRLKNHCERKTYVFGNKGEKRAVEKKEKNNG